MGLDIYFYKGKSLAQSREERIKEDIAAFEKADEEGEMLDEDLYFRKVNLLVRYFDYNENCSYKPIEKEEVEELLERCDKVLEVKNTDVSMEYLPTCCGFFFGSTDYDEWYYTVVGSVKEAFESLKIDWDKENLYIMCSW